MNQIESSIAATARHLADPIRVLHVASGDLWAGAEVQIYHLMRAMRGDPRLHLHVALLNDGELASRLRTMNIEVSVLDEARLSSLAIIMRLRRLIRCYRADVIHTHRTKENVLGSFATALSRRGVSLRTIHGNPEYSTLRSRLMNSVDRFCARRLQKCLVAVSEPLSAQVSARFPGVAVECIPNGIDAAFVEEQSRAGSADLAADAIHVAFIGRLVPVKRVDLFIQIAADLERRRPGEFKFHIIGDGPLSDTLKEQASGLTQRRVVQFHGFHANCMPLLRRMSALLLTSDHEGLPMIALEALALGVPVIAHAVGGLPHLIEQAGAGMALHTQQPEAFAEAIESTARPAQCSLLPQEYTAASSAARYCQVYDRYKAGN